MTILDILDNVVAPFEYSDKNVIKIFSFFLHLAPTIESKTSNYIDKVRLEQNWDKYINTFSNNSYVFLASSCKFENYLEKYSLSSTFKLNRRAKGFICKRKDNNETDYECILRHLRNAIAHSNVYVISGGNRKYFLFEDFNLSGNQSARILFSQTDLKNLKNNLIC